MSEFEQKQVVIGDMNARNRIWDRRKNQRGSAVNNVVNKTERNYVFVAEVPCYFKVIKREK